MNKNEYTKYKIREALSNANLDKSYLTIEDIAEEIIEGLGEDRSKFLIKELKRKYEN